MHPGSTIMNNPNCTTILLGNDEMVQRMSPQMTIKTFRVSLLMLFNAILMGVVVVIGAYAPRYRQHPVISAATALFLPIISTIVTTIDSVHGLIETLLIKVQCNDRPHLNMVFAWTGVVVAIGINASVVVAGDAREGRNIAPPIILLVKASWSAYLAFSTLYPPKIALVHLFVIMFAKLLFKYVAFYMAQRSFALGRSPRLIAGYMAQLQQPDDDEHTDTAPPPPALIVMGEDKVQVEEQTHGYNLKQMPSDQKGDGDMTRANRLVTLDRVWRFGRMEARPKDLCYAFALFKLLRCRFAKYTVSEAGFIKTSKFFRKTLLQDEDHYGRVFRIITDELSFISDYYYSSLPIYYSHPLLPAFGVTLSLWSIGYCLWMVVYMTQDFVMDPYRRGQINCLLQLTRQDCGNETTSFGFVGGYPVVLRFGSLYYDIVPLYLAMAVLVLAEAREIASYICSNWTKVTLIYHHVNGDWWQRPRVVQKCIFALVKYHRCKLVKNWEDKIKQCSILVLRPRKTLLRRLRHLLRFEGGQEKVKVPNDVKAAIFQAIKGESFTTEKDGALCWLIRPPSSPIPAVYHLYAYNNGKHRAAYSILVWNISTSVFEASQLPQPSSESDHKNKTVATHLSRYCTYLVTSRPELLPDDAEWCRKLYDEVKKDADRVLAKVQGVDDHNQLIQELTADSNHEVLRNGARLGKQLVEDYSARGWERLARFWVEMTLYVAPSENLEAHAEAISHGGELVTLLWAMLAHAGITGRIDAEDVVAATDDQPA